MGAYYPRKKGIIHIEFCLSKGTRVQGRRRRSCDIGNNIKGKGKDDAAKEGRKGERKSKCIGQGSITSFVTYDGSTEHEM